MWPNHSVRLWCGENAVEKRSSPRVDFLVLVSAISIAAMVLMPPLANAGLESSLVDIKMKLTGVILPLLSVIGIAIAAISFFTGNPQAKQHIFYAILGCMFGFGAQAIVDFISQSVH